MAGRRGVSRLLHLLVGWIACMALLPSLRADTTTTAVDSEQTAADPMLTLLLKRVQDQPNHSDSWRVLGGYQAQRGDVPAGMQSLAHALQLDPDNAAAHFDYGELLHSTGDVDRAQMHFQTCLSLAPTSHYAAQIIAHGWLPPGAISETPSADRSDHSSTIELAGYRIQTFDGADDLERTWDRLESDADPASPNLRWFLETGVLYNSNVSLTPISRELANSSAESFQWIANPEVEWIAWKRDTWKNGLILRSFLTLNESSQTAFNLASVQPGGFVERDFGAIGSDWTARFDYVYSLDYLDQLRVGDRHRVTASLIQIRPDLDVLYGYLTTSFSNFADDGSTPTTTSLDGWAVSGGISRFFQTDWQRLPTFSLGIDLESADTEGSNFRYRGMATHGEWTIRLHRQFDFLPSAGLGFRDYYSFDGVVPRDEWIWRVQGKLVWQVREHVDISWVAGHDRFASDNANFDAERTQGGVLITVTH